MELDTGDRVRTITPGHPDRSPRWRGARWEGDRSSGDGDNSVRIWSTETGTPRVPADGPTSRIVVLSFSPMPPHRRR